MFEEVLNTPLIQNSQIRNTVRNTRYIDVLLVVLCWVCFFLTVSLFKKGPTAWICFFLTDSLFETKKDLVLAKSYYNAAGRRFSKNIRKFAETRLQWIPFLAKSQFFKMDSAVGVFLSVFRTPLYRCFQTLNRNAFLWKITLLGAKTPVLSKICQKVVGFFY